MGEKRKLLSVDLEDVGLRGDLMIERFHGVGSVAEEKGILFVQAAGMVAELVGESLKIVADGVEVPDDDGQVNRDGSGDSVTSFGLVV